MAEQNRPTSDPSSVEQPATQSNIPSDPITASIDSELPRTSLNDSGLSKRPRDVRLIHMILANYGVTAYQERVPLQLMDFAYRYTSAVLQDALHLTTEPYGSSGPIGGRGNTANNDQNSISLNALRLSIASRTHYQFSPNLPKEFYQELATERNRIALPVVGKESGLMLPPERYCLTGVGWGLKEEWDSEAEVDEEDSHEAQDTATGERADGDSDQEEDEKMEDFFGEELDGGGEDDDMEGE